MAGFGSGRGYEFDEFFADAATAGLRVDLALESWDVRPFTDDSGFLVAVLAVGGLNRTGRPDRPARHQSWSV